MNIAILTCQKLPDLNPEDQKIIPALAKHNINAKAVIWSDKTINWADFDYLIFRNTWDYFEKETEFNIWLHQIEKLGIKTLNPIEIIKQNIHKFYLREMQKQGITILPTVFIDKTDTLNLAEHLPSHWKKAVIKPAFSAGSYLTEVFETSDSEEINQKYATIAAEKELLLQEFMPEIQTLGETSFIFFNKKFSHAVNKKPVDGDFRVQSLFGGIYNLVHPSSELIEKAQKVVDTFQENLLYARVDGILIDNELYLMEIECIEPDLYFNLSEGSLERFVTAIVELIQ
ncbi:ATP-grasp domain-containing protein [Flavobacterium sp. LS1P28]|uniref:ATP-grasp domain-containing protein n=1 Tax=unclassified Flavobacterium TaxID=196869 RepID=UPI000F8422CB|nr:MULTISPECIES: ATP-grasp domain-containing protein [unclassified Flavobacterium]RTY74583.1 ATP-grasp domain-containing protein [Flavobacterium sp. LS1R10]RTY80620.1 ATP-grasp domain-containing protein [Flavobacterium sp. LS1P28]RTY87824.1 ATP-grasp domain-containing protein [Flavobacterium sp. RSP15]